MEGFGVVGRLGFGVVGRLGFGVVFRDFLGVVVRDVLGVVGRLEIDPVRRRGNRYGETVLLSASSAYLSMTQ